MSRRAPDPAAERAARNQQTIKNLLKLEGNKSCADCKRNKHPRWASWNLGIFICIRCSGIHRGMGTHISRVKSVDLDSWTDEQLQSVLKWGNSRANKYWEAKLAPGHAPSEAKIENFIRTKYDSKRWVMEGPMPDPSTLDADGDDDVPLTLVKEKQAIERSSSQRVNAPSISTAIKTPQPDLFGNDDHLPVDSSSTPTSRAQGHIPQVSQTAPPKPTKPADSLLGLDFFGNAAEAPSRPSSAATTSRSSGQSRPDLKQSILSLYATAPRSQPQAQQTERDNFGGMQSPPISRAGQDSLFGMNDAFAGLNFAGNASAPPAALSQPSKPSPFSGLGDLTSQRPAPPIQSSNAGFSSGSFFDPKPAPKSTVAPAQASREVNPSGGFRAFDSPRIATSAQIRSSASKAEVGNLFDFGTSASVPAAVLPKQSIASPSPQLNRNSSSVFNISAHPQQPKVEPPMPANNGWGSSDAWGSNDAWSSQSNPSVAKPSAQTSTNAFGWSSAGGLASSSIVPGGEGGFSANNPISRPAVSADDDFGGWSSAAPVTPGIGTVNTSTGKPAAGFATSEDLFSNVWE